MYQEIKVKKAQVKEIVERTFPEYAGRKFVVRFTDHIILHDTNWGGGSRNVYKAMNARGDVAGLQGVGAPWDNRAEGQRVNIPVDVIIVEHCTFCGQDLGLRFYANPANTQRYLLGVPK